MRICAETDIDPKYLWYLCYFQEQVKFVDLRDKGKTNSCVFSN